MTAIEFVRTKINLDNFLLNFGKVNQDKESKIQAKNNTE